MFVSGAKLRVSVIGTGRMARIYADLLAQRPDAELAGVCGRTPEKTRAFAERFGIPGYDGGSVGDLIAQRPEADAYVIATPEWVRLEPLRAALRTGKHVLVEKPLAASPEDAEALDALSPAEKARITVAHSLRFSPRFSQARAAVAAGAIGEVRHIYTRRNANTEAAKRVVGRFDLAYWLSCHDLDLMRWFVGDEVESAYAVSRNGFRDEDDYLLAHLHFRGGVDALHEVSWCTPPLSDQAPMCSFSIRGTKGMIEIDDSSSGVDVYQSGAILKSPDTYEMYEAAGGHYGLFADLIDRWVRTVRDGLDTYPGFDDAMAAVRAGTLIMKSIRSGRKESVD